MRARSCANECLPAMIFLPLQLGQMFIVEPIRRRDVPLVEPAVPGLVPADQQDGDAPRIERVEDPDGPPAALDAQLPQMRMPRSRDPARIGKRQVWTLPLQLANM